MNDSALEQMVRAANPVPAAQVAGAWADAEAEGQRSRIVSSPRPGGGGRARRRLGALVTAALFAGLLAVLGALLLARGRTHPSPSAPAATPSEQFVPLVPQPRFSVFARPARSSDRPPALPVATKSFPVPAGEAWRLAMSRSGINVYVASASAGRPKGVCISIFRGHTPDIFNCPALQIAAAGRVVLPVRRRGLPGYLVGLVPDGVVRVSDALRSVAVDGNVYVLRRQPWVMPSAVTYRLADGSSRKVLLP